MGKIIAKVYSFLVDTAEVPVNKKFDLDKNVQLVRGILLSSNQLNLLFYRGTQRIEISGEEIFPEDFESKILMSGLSVAPNQKFKTLNEGKGVIAGNGEVKIQYKDVLNPNAPFTAYQVNIILQCEMK